MPPQSRPARVLIYSHDSFGLGHLRRCRTIAHAIVDDPSGPSVLVLSGSPIIGSFDFRPRVDFVRVPGVIKLRNGEYSSLSLDMGIDELLRMRASIIQHTAEVFEPDVFIVDKEPLGLRGEIHTTLEALKRRGTRLVLGLRDVMDDPELLATEWKRKNPIPALTELYDDILIYGLPQICDPLDGIDLPESVHQKISYTGYLRRSSVERPTAFSAVGDTASPYVLVTTGGGGDGEALIDWVLKAYESGAQIPLRAQLVFGPFMEQRKRDLFSARVARLERVEAITFDAHVEARMKDAFGVVAMGGYNTFCEILSFDKPAIIVPRTRPRMEQHIRASRAEELGLVRMLEADEFLDPAKMANALQALVDQNRPSDVVVPGLLEGLDNIRRLVSLWTRDPGVIRASSARG
ncbi:MAG: putative glycosyltransferase [Gammaproteobacteria bacterium]|jgi:predicted glycosyltransferase